MSSVSTRQKAGLVLAGALCAANIASPLLPTPDDQEGPPIAVLAVGAVLGVIGRLAVVLAWRNSNQAAARVAAGTLVLNMILSLPAFFVDVPASIRLLSALAALLSIAAIVLMLSPVPRPGLDRQPLS